MKKYEIEITYSFDDSIETMGYFDTPEEAYERMCQLAATESYVQGSEFRPEQECTVYFHPFEKEIDLHYLSDGEWCYYRVKKDSASELNSFVLSKWICDCLSGDNEESREETETALYNELSQISNDSFIKAAFLRLCERVKELED